MASHLRRSLLLALATALLAPLTLAQQATATTTVTTVSTVARDAAAGMLAAGQSRTLLLGGPVRDLAVHWRGASEATVTVALSTDGVGYAAPVDVGRDEVGEGRGNGRTYGALLPAGGAVSLRVSTDTALRDLRVVGLTDGKRSTRTMTRPVGAAAAVAQPAVLSRAQWGADESLRFDANGKEKFPPAFYPTKKLIVHHTAGANDDPDPAATIRSIYYYHAVTQNWGDIGYNFLVDESGRVYEGRYSRSYPAGTYPSGDNAAGEGVTGAHTGGWNSGTVGVALLGTLTSRDATPAARDALTSFLAWEAERNGLDPKATTTFVNPVSGATRTTPNIAGHRDYGSTECPGGTFYATLPALRTAVADRIAGTTTEPAPDPAPEPVADTTAPTAPASLTASAGSRSVRLTWSASSDDVGVTGYTVARSATSATSGWNNVATTSATTWTSTGLKRDKRYWFRVRATDAAGNLSPWSTVASAVAG